MKCYNCYGLNAINFFEEHSPLMLRRGSDILYRVCIGSYNKPNKEYIEVDMTLYASEDNGITWMKFKNIPYVELINDLKYLDDEMIWDMVEIQESRR